MVKNLTFQTTGNYSKTHLVKVAGWELPADVSCLIRTTHLKTHKVKEHIYKRKHAAENKVRQLIADETHEFVVCTHDAIHHIHPHRSIDDDE